MRTPSRNFGPNARPFLSVEWDWIAAIQTFDQERLKPILPFLRSRDQSFDVGSWPGKSASFDLAIHKLLQVIR